VCGICGAIQVGGAPRALLDPAVLDRMTDAMAHRGPDDRAAMQQGGVAFGARRLSIVDVAGGHQPFVTEDETVWGMQNGEIYNHVELRRQLERSGHRLRSRCDTEVIPHLYEQHGDAFVEHLRGKYALAVWDGRRRRCVLARDRLGVKPLYFALAGDVLVFASELKSVLMSGLVRDELDVEAIDAYLTLGYFPGPSTPLAQVRKLQPGCVLVVDEHGARERRYWSHPLPDPGPVEAGADHYGEQLLEALSEAVRLRLMSDVPLGAMLSGGLDSSLVVALMAREGAAPVRTFSVGFAGSETNELSDASRVASALGAEHHELELRLDEPQVSLEDLVWHLDEPLASLSSLGFHALSGLASEHVSVALSGQGADELLGGYRKHLAASLAGRWQRIPAPARAAGERLARIRSPQVAGTLAAGDPVSRLLAMSGRLDAATRARIVTGPLAETDGGAARRALEAVAGDLRAGPLAETMYLDARTSLVDDMLHYFDRTSMAHSLEVRVPFLDHRLVELCATIPDAFKVRGLTTKWLLKRVARGLVPDEVIDKRKVGFFHRAIGEWMGGQLRGATADHLLDPQPRYAELLDRTAIERIAIDHRDGRDTRHGHLLLSVLMLEIWLKTVLPIAREQHSPAVASAA
jgi:asparagine synthase (glutamine-hydrolysing)